MPKPTASSSSELTPYRERRPLYAAHGINLYPFLHGQDRAGWELLRTAIANWLDHLYGEASFFYPGLGNDFLQHLLDSTRLHPELTSIPELLNTIGAYRGPFYKMVQGSVTFDKGDSLHCPPLERLVIIDPQQPRALFIWQYATPSLLSALLGERTASQLIQADRLYTQEHRHFLPVKRVEEILSHDLAALARWHTLQTWMTERPPATLVTAPIEAVEQQGATRSFRETTLTH